LLDPVMFVEHILLYSTRGEVPENAYKIPLGQADIKRPGSDVTIVSYSRMVQVSLDAAEELAQAGIQAEVVDLRTLRPLDAETVVNSVKKTHKALVVEETSKFGGFSGEVVSQLQEDAFEYLDAPVARVAGEEVPIPYSLPLERLATPDAERVAQAVRNLVGR
jgi:pyruvate dehydrogenase E1 component beta subunit